jgi:hypothetical protein
MPVATQRGIATWSPAGIYMQYLFLFAWHVLLCVYFYAACCFIVLILMYLFLYSVKSSVELMLLCYIHAESK